MDCHITTLDFAIVNDAGRLIKSYKVATSVKNYMEFVKKVPRIIYMGENALAAWALETCNRFKEKVVITDPTQNLEFKVNEGIPNNQQDLLPSAGKLFLLTFGFKEGSLHIDWTLTLASSIAPLI